MKKLETTTVKKEQDRSWSPILRQGQYLMHFHPNVSILSSDHVPLEQQPWRNRFVWGGCYTFLFATFLPPRYFFYFNFFFVLPGAPVRVSVAVPKKGRGKNHSENCRKEFSAVFWWAVHPSACGSRARECYESRGRR